MKKGQTVMQAAQKLATQHIRKSIDRAVTPILTEINEYISEVVGVNMPEIVPEISNKSAEELVREVLDTVKVVPAFDGLKIEIDLESITGLVTFIDSILQYNHELIGEIGGYLDQLDLDVDKIKEIVVKNIKIESER